MSQVSYIKYLDIKEARRYDADFFMPEFLEMDKIIRNGLPIIQIAKTVDLQSNGAFADIYTTLNDGNEKTIPYIRSTNVGDFFLNKNDLEFISKEAHEKLLKTHTKIHDILMARKGKIGGATIVLSQDTDLNTNDNVVNIKIIDQRINPFYLITFLNSRYGILQVNRFATGNVQPWLSMHQVRILKVPLVKEIIQFQIEQIVKSAHEKQTLSKKLYKEAEELLLAELGLLNYPIKHELTFYTSKKEIEEAHRYDSEYFQPKYAEIIKKIEKYVHGWDLVKNQFNQNTTLSKKDGNYCNYIEISDVNVLNGEITPTRVEIKDIPANGKRKLFKNDLLISKVRPYRGAISFIDFEADNLLGSGAFTVLQEKTEYRKEVLMIFLKTVFIKELLLRYNCGSSYPVIKDEDILNLKIPLIKLSIQKQIAEKIQESHRLRKESKQLLEEAKRKVEEEIEKENVIN